MKNKRSFTARFLNLLIIFSFITLTASYTRAYDTEIKCAADDDGLTKISVYVTDDGRPVDCAVVEGTIPVILQQKICEQYKRRHCVRSAWENVYTEYLPVVFPPTGLSGVPGESYMVVPDEYILNFAELTGIGGIPYRILFQANCSDISVEEPDILLDDCDASISCESPETTKMREGCCAGKIKISMKSLFGNAEEMLVYCLSFENFHVENLDCAGHTFYGFDFGQTFCAHMGYLLDQLSQHSINLGMFLKITISGSTEWNYPAICGNNGECADILDEPTFGGDEE